MRQVREGVRFADAVRELDTAGVTGFVELGPDGTLTALVEQSLDAPTATPVLRRDRPEADTLVTALARVYVRGHGVDWAALFGPARPPRVELPTYPFQRTRYWLEPATRTADAAGLGLGAVEHAVLAGALLLPDADGVLLTGSLGLRTHPWLADHVALGTAIAPGAALVELAIRAGDEVGAGLLEELVVEAPLVLPEQGALQVQVAVGEPDATGARPVRVHARRGEGTAWTRHASGTLLPTPAAAAGSTTQAVAWPPPGAEELPVEEVYQVLAGAGLTYGPAFRGLRAVWRDGEEYYAEAALPPALVADAGRFGLHPALLDAAAQLPGLHESADRRHRLPFAYRGVTLHAAGAAELRVRLTVTGPESYALLATDAAGQPVLTIDTLTTRPVQQGVIGTPSTLDRDALFAVEWPVLAAATPAGSSAAVADTEAWTAHRIGEHAEVRGALGEALELV
ncbi:polyketide synthase dehydratase domain-containing protein, partial [Kitasatospora nipponensis]|uniref:polyketide synthase dehydratase domain-containing protein n=1 Tax=Kitasatospora nipponensis TaxID=258049 RepID=UPI0031DBEB2E